MKKNKIRSVILLSGGFDSAANLAICAEQDEPVLALTADYGQRAAKREIKAAERFANYYGVGHRVLAMDWLGRLGGSSLTESDREIPELQRERLDDLAMTQESAKSVWVPNRNGILINAAAAFAERLGCEQVVVGFNREEAVTFPDNSADFLERASFSLALSTANSVSVACYTVHQNKREIAARITKLNRSFPFDFIWSCYAASERPCARCESCQRLARALATIGLSLPGAEVSRP